MPAAFQIEDALLFVWLVVVTPLLQVVLGGAMRGLSLGNLDHSAPDATALGVVFLGATLAAAVCTLTRAPGDEQAKEPVTGTPFGYAHLPMMAATAIMLFLGLALLGLDDASPGLMCLWFGLFVVVAMVYPRMPVLDFSLRRILMTPFIILSTTIFTSSINPILAGVDPKGLFRIAQSELGRFELGLILAGTLVYYLMFVFAPRQIAGGGGSWRQWALRFVLYVVGLILNIGFLQSV